MSTIILTRGLPGSGKTTAAMLHMESARDYTIRLSRDDDRLAMFNVVGIGSKAQEAFITETHISRARLAIKMGLDVLVDATHLNSQSVRPWKRLANEMHVSLQFWTFEIPVGEAIYRDESRGGAGGRRVGRQVIESMARRNRVDFNTGALAPIAEPAKPERPNLRPAVWDDLLPTAIIVDTDGTLANHEGVRDPYDTSRYHLDKVHKDVALAVSRLADEYVVIGVSGRSEEFAQVTKNWWLGEARLTADEFYFRPSGDSRPDDIIKAEIYENHIRGRYNVLGVFDDRARVLRMWRAKGLTTFAVGDTESNDF